MSEARHTPGEWKAGRTFCTHNSPTRFWEAVFHSSSGIGVVAVGIGASREESDANAARIVLCCNLHDELLEAMRELMCWEGPGTAQEQGCKCETLGEALELCRAIIAKATA